MTSPKSLPPATAAFIFAYSVLLRQLLGLSLLLLPLSSGLRRHRIPERLAYPAASSATPLIWLHAASLGEVRVLLRFTELLLSVDSSLRFVATATSNAGEALLRSRAGNAFVYTGFLPPDTGRRVSDFLTRFSVSRLWLIETEIWPALIAGCMRAGIPVGIVNARLEEKTLKGYARLSFAFRPLFSWLDPVLAQDETYAARFRAMGVSPAAVKVAGNIKSAVSLRSVSTADRSRLRSGMGLDPAAFVVVVGCVHPGEAALMCAACSALALDPGAKLIFAPRHPEKTAQIAGEIPAEFSVVENLDLGDTASVVVVRSFGVLEDLYRIADAVIMGGTYAPVGGHNIWEAAQFGVPVFFGSQYHTQRQSFERLQTAGLAFRADDAVSLAEAITRHCTTDRSIFDAALAAFDPGPQPLLEYIAGMSS